MSKIAFFAIFVLVVFLFGCSQQATTTEKQTTAKQAPAQASDVSKPAAEQKATSVTVNIYDSGFRPAEVTISKGGTVKWVNMGQKDHTVYGATFPMPTSTSPKNSGRLQPGESWEKAFGTEGYFGYTDLYDDSMKGKVVVVA